MSVKNQVKGAVKALLSATDILDSDDLPTQVVECPEWGGNVLIGTMSGTERDTFETSLAGKGGKNDTTNLRAAMVAATAVDAEGKRLFTAAQVLLLGKKNAKALDRCFDAARELNGMFKAVEDEVKGNS